MKLIIAGCRHFTTSRALELVREAVKRSGWAHHVTEVVSGAAPGIDTAGEAWALEHNLPVRLFPANWTKYGKSAGPKRNEEMSHYGDALVAIWDGQSKGTKSMLEQMKKRQKPVYVMRVDQAADK